MRHLYSQNNDYSQLWYQLLIYNNNKTIIFVSYNHKYTSNIKTMEKEKIFIFILFDYILSD